MQHSRISGQQTLVEYSVTEYLIKRSLTQSTKLSSMYVSVEATGRFPVINSRSMTPKENTSDLSVSFPLEAYSGAR